MIGLIMVLLPSESMLAFSSQCLLERMIIPPHHRAVQLLLRLQFGTLTHRPLDRLDRLAHAIPGTEGAEHLDQGRMV